MAEEDKDQSLLKKPLNRRQFLALTGAAAVATLTSAWPKESHAQESEQEPEFTISEVRFEPPLAEGQTTMSGTHKIRILFSQPVTKETILVTIDPVTALEVRDYNDYLQTKPEQPQLEQEEDVEKRSITIGAETVFKDGNYAISISDRSISGTGSLLKLKPTESNPESGFKISFIVKNPTGI